MKSLMVCVDVKHHETGTSGVAYFGLRRNAHSSPPTCLLVGRGGGGSRRQIEEGGGEARLWGKGGGE